VVPAKLKVKASIDGKWRDQLIFNLVTPTKGPPVGLDATINQLATVTAMRQTITDAAGIRWVRGAAVLICLMHLVFVTFLLLPVVGQAAEPSEVPPELNGTLPNCSPPMDGQVFCKFGTLYECTLVGPNSMERRTGWRWRADVLRGCAEATPATIEQENGLPPDITYLPQQTNRSGARGGR
jgi:hypothetical protein